jgi:NADP-dependent 3-hydroxy acid dehydrogenase YdfG
MATWTLQPEMTAIVTGASSGIGLSITRMLARDLGCLVVMNGRNEDRLVAAKASLCEDGISPDRLHVLAGDMGKAETSQKLVAKALAVSGRVDIVINNAGLGLRFVLLQEITPAEVDAVVDTNLKGPAYLMQAAIPAMVNAGRSGAIVNINSIAGLKPFAYSAVYCASKYGLKGLSEAVAAEQAANGIRVMSVYPGEVDTPIWQQLEPGVAQETEKMLTAQSVADAVRFLLTQPGDSAVSELTLVPPSRLGFNA